MILERCDHILNLGRKPTVPEVLPIVRAFYAKPGNEVGGSLHVVLDDGNVGDDHLNAAVESARETGDADGEMLGRVLLLCSRTQRLKVYHSR
jgi:hypothetical protein